MTKQVRVENADLSGYVVVVETWEKGANGNPDTLIATQKLAHPTAMTGPEVCITSTRYLVVKEEAK